MVSFCIGSLLTLGYSSLDILLSTLAFCNATNISNAFLEVEHFDYWSSIFDLWLLCLVRFIILAIVIANVLCLRQKCLERICRLRLLFIVIAMMMMVYSPVKLLAHCEVVRDPLAYQPYFWILFTWNIVASCTFVFLFVYVIEQLKLPPRVGGVLLLVNDVSSNHVSDRAVLIDTSEETQPQTDASSSTGKGRKRKDSEEERLKEELRKLGTKAKTSLALRLLNYCKQEWLLFLAAFTGLLLYSAARIFVPYYTGQVIANIVVTKSYQNLLHSVLMMVLLTLASGFFSGIRGGFFSYANSRVNINVRDQLFRSLLDQDIGFFDTVKTGDITSRLTADTQTMSDTVGLNVNVFLRSLMIFIGSLVVMFKLSWKLALLNFIALPLITVISEIYGKYYERLSKETQDTLATANEVADEVLSTMRTVRSFANETAEGDRYLDRLNETLGVKKRQAFALSGYYWVNEIFDLSLLVGVLWYGGHLVLTKQMPSENLISYLLYQMQLGDALMGMGAVYTGLMQAVGASHKVFQFIDRQPAISNDGRKQLARLDGRIDFNNVKFSYPSRPDAQVLNDISFSVSPGEVVALVGPSGGGKSSCISLIEHFYEPSSGNVLIDGIDVREFDHKFIHNKVSLVGQEPVLYAKTVRENIAYGLDEGSWTNEEVEGSAKLANAHQFITEMPAGYETDTGEKGVQLSGGQKQRVAIARALIRHPRILLLDEATSALDSESEYLVQQAIYKNLSGHTVLLIAHRLSTVERADRIVVINKGQVEQQGTHLELLNQEGLYKNLVHRQLLAGDSKPAGSSGSKSMATTARPRQLSINQGSVPSSPVPVRTPTRHPFMPEPAAHMSRKPSYATQLSNDRNTP